MSISLIVKHGQIYVSYKMTIYMCNILFGPVAIVLLPNVKIRPSRTRCDSIAPVGEILQTPARDWRDASDGRSHKLSLTPRPEGYRRRVRQDGRDARTRWRTSGRLQESSGALYCYGFAIFPVPPRIPGRFFMQQVASFRENASFRPSVCSYPTPVVDR